jgi:hypothetical protein
MSNRDTEAQRAVVGATVKARHSPDAPLFRASCLPAFPPIFQADLLKEDAMKRHLFSVPLQGPAPAALDALFASARFATIDLRLIAERPHSQWAIFVTTLDGPASSATEASSRPRVDYHKKLPPVQFESFARLRALRKQVAHAEDVPPYVVFNDEHLAQIALSPVMVLSTLAGLPGVGPNRVEKYGAAVLAAAAGP